MNENEEKKEKTIKEIEIEIKGLQASNKILMDYQKQSKKENKRKFIIIVILILGLIIETLSFVWYESQFETIETVEDTKEYEMSTEGDNASINNVEGNQYNDNASHTENK